MKKSTKGKIILSKYTFTFYMENGKRYISCEYPPVTNLHDIDSIYSYCFDVRNENKDNIKQKEEKLQDDLQALPTIHKRNQELKKSIKKFIKKETFIPKKKR